MLGPLPEAGPPGPRFASFQPWQIFAVRFFCTKRPRRVVQAPTVRSGWPIWVCLSLLCNGPHDQNRPKPLESFRALKNLDRVTRNHTLSDGRKLGPTVEVNGHPITNRGPPCRFEDRKGLEGRTDIREQKAQSENKKLAAYAFGPLGSWWKRTRHPDP